MEILNLCYFFILLKFVSSNFSENSNNDCEQNYENYLSFIKKQEFTVILFYTPYHKSYRNLGFTLKEIKLKKEIAICKINIHENKEFAKQYSLDSSPSFIIFYRSRKYYIQYKNTIELENIIQWINEKTENYIERLSKYEEIVSLATQNNNLTVVFFGETKIYDREFRIFRAVGRNFDSTKIKFYFCERCKEFNIFDLAVYNKNDKIKTLYKKSSFKSKINYDNFFRFIDTNIKPLVREVSYEFNDDIFKYKNPGLIIYYDPDLFNLTTETENYKLLRKFAYKNKVFI